MKTLVGTVLAVALVAPASLAAHRLDEYLQASRLQVTRGQVTVEIDLAPGASIADPVAALVDTDHDGRFSPLEAEVYGRAVLADVHIDADGRAVPLALTRVEVPTMAEMSEGVGMIRLRADGDLRTVAGRRLRLVYRNSHRSDSSVYLVNALVPASRDIAMAAQSRDQQQREIRLEYDVSSRWMAQIAWLMASIVGVGGLVVMRWTGGRARVE